MSFSFNIIILLFGFNYNTSLNIFDIQVIFIHRIICGFHFSDSASHLQLLHQPSHLALVILDSRLIERVHTDSHGRKRTRHLKEIDKLSHVVCVNARDLDGHNRNTCLFMRLDNTARRAVIYRLKRLPRIRETRRLRDHKIIISLPHPYQRLIKNPASLLQKLPHRMKISRKTKTSGERPLAFLALTFTEQLLQPFTEIIKV